MYIVYVTQIYKYKEGPMPYIPKTVYKRGRVLVVSWGQSLVKGVSLHGVQHLVRQRLNFGMVRPCTCTATHLTAMHHAQIYLFLHAAPHLGYLHAMT